jgi:hypothetical protein
MRFTLLRAFVLLAVIANLVFAAWHAGLLKGIGLSPRTQRDPQRVEQQVRPQALRVLGPDATAAAVAAGANAAAVVGSPSAAADALTNAASSPMGSSSLTQPAAAPAAAPASAPGSTSATAPTTREALACIEVGPVEPGAAQDALERALAAVAPARAVARETRPTSAQYAVFVGPVLSREAARQRRDELIKLKISFEPIEIVEGRAREKLGGYALGRHDSEAAATAALDELRTRGLRNARVVLAREQGALRTWLKLDRLTGTQADAVRALPAASLAGAKAGECVVGSVMSVTAPTR